MTTSLILRTCAADMTARNGFKWPESGPVECPDWSPNPVCGQGLHGALNGEGDGSLFSWDEDARWLVVEVPTESIVDLGGKVKFPRGTVVFCGDRHGATAYMAERLPGRAIIGCTATGGYGSTLTGGDDSTLTGGDDSTLTGGDGSTLTGGNRSTLILRWWDGNNYRIAVGYVGENGIDPDVAYRLDDKGRFEQVGS